MEQVFQLIENGRAGYVAAMGMGGVFAALIFLFLFIFILGKAHRFKKVRSRSLSAPALKPEPEPDAANTAAAVAVALVLSDQSRRTGVSVSPVAEEEPSPWKVAGRLAMMRPFFRPKKD